eukprot:GEMP01093351.1.p1 GENE.GEMP01093351.1~~GEMP01093351.1.p1  ORF type:complete len:244 (+),score=34.13 GEMP01093351.1:155-886(+)
MPLQRLATGPIRDDATSGVSTATAGSDQRSFAVQKTTSKSTVEKPLLPGTPEHAEKQTVYSRATKTELTDKRSSRRASSYHGRSETGSQDSPTESQRMRRKTASLRIWTTNSIMSTEQEQRKSERVTVVGNIQRQTSKNVRFDVPKTSSYYASSPGSSETDVSNGDVGTASSRFSIVGMGLAESFPCFSSRLSHTHMEAVFLSLFPVGKFKGWREGLSSNFLTGFLLLLFRVVPQYLRLRGGN